MVCEKDAMTRSVKISVAFAETTSCKMNDTCMGENAAALCDATFTSEAMKSIGTGSRVIL